MISSSMLRKKDECLKHGHEKSFYCLNCAIAVCPECFFTEDSHQGHRQRPLQSVYEENKVHLLEKDKGLDSSTLNFLKRRQEMSKRIQEIKTKETSELFEIKEFF